MTSSSQWSRNKKQWKKTKIGKTVPIAAVTYINIAIRDEKVERLFNSRSNTLEGLVIENFHILTSQVWDLQTAKVSSS